MSKNPFDLITWRSFWQLIEREWAEIEKFKSNYWGNYGPPCDCGSSTCDECNPQWEDERFLEELEEEDYYG